MTSLRAHWADGEEVVGVWLTLPGEIAAELAARQPFDYVCVDTQHGVIGYEESVSMIQAIEGAGGTPIARVPWNEPGIIGKTLDAGAHGVIVPMVNTREQAESVVRSCRYAPEGSRSWGPIAIGLRHTDNRAWAGDNIAVIPMIETVEALSNLDEILSVAGIDAIYVGPADLSITLGLDPGNNDGVPAFDDALTTIVAACGRHGVVPGIHSSGTLAARRREQGFRMITVATDTAALRSAYADEVATAHGHSADGGSDSIY